MNGRVIICPDICSTHSTLRMFWLLGLRSDSFSSTRKRGRFLKKLPLTGLHQLKKGGGFKQFLLCNQLPSWERFVHIPFVYQLPALWLVDDFPATSLFGAHMFPLVPWRVIGIPTKKSHEPGSKLLVLGMVIQPLIGNPYSGYINPYYWVDDHPLLLLEIV